MRPDSRYMRSGHRVTSKQPPWLRCCFSWQVAQERRLILITWPVSHEGRQTLVLVTCLCIHTHTHTHAHAHAHIPNLPSYFPFRHSHNVCNFPLSSYVFLFFPSFCTKQELHNCGWLDQMTLCFHPWCPEAGTNSTNITAMFSPFSLGWTSTWHICTCELMYGPDSPPFILIKPIGVSPKLLWCLLEECVCVSHVCFHLLVSAQTKMTHAIFLWCNTQIQWDVESWDFNRDIYFTHRAHQESEHRFLTVATPMQHFHKW